MQPVYVLNNSCQYISDTKPMKALKLVDDGKALVLKWSDVVIQGVSGVIKVPQVIQLFRYVKAIRNVVQFSRPVCWERDDYTCQYCSKVMGKNSKLIQTDHVFPESRGGPSTYDNMVTACFRCNQKKRNRTPKEAGMKLIRLPVVPKLTSRMARINDEIKEILAEEYGTRI